jgi:hypothetical protein
MGFITSGDTITVQAKLTTAGRRKLYQSIEGQSGTFITKFGLGDSDANYVAIEAGAGPLVSGHVPIAGDFQSRPRSHALYRGVYRPGVPVVYFNDSPGPEVHGFISIGGGSPSISTFNLKTEWPKGEIFNEGYWHELRNPTSIEDSRFEEIFTTRITGDNVLELKFHGGLSLVEISQLVGSNVYGESDFMINVTGKQTRRFNRIWITVIQ